MIGRFALDGGYAPTMGKRGGKSVEELLNIVARARRWKD
jgi:hypothetical protein